MLSGRYQLVEPLARGGMATVWIADDRVLSRRVAVKVLRADLAEDDALRTRFRNEAVAAAKVAHPNIVATYDTGDDDGTAYIVMELVNGPTLRRIIDDVGGLPVRDVVRIGEQVADALDAAHRAGLVHRDVKPANVLVPEGGPVKVTDFGIAKAIGTDDLTRTGTVMGTARYLSPEQVNGHATDARTDVYGLGLLLFEMLCGHPPFGGDTEIATAMARLTTSAPSVRTDRPDAPAALDDIVHRCLARRPDARYESARGVHDALARLRAPQTRAAPAPEAGTEAGAATRPRRPAPAPVVRPRSCARAGEAQGLRLDLGRARGARRARARGRGRLPRHPRRLTGRLGRGECGHGRAARHRGRVGVRPLRRRPGGRPPRRRRPSTTARTPCGPPSSTRTRSRTRRRASACASISSRRR